MKGSGKVEDLDSICDLVDADEVPEEFQETIVEVVLDDDIDYQAVPLPDAEDYEEYVQELTEEVLLPAFNELEELIVIGREARRNRECSNKRKLD